jgi:hypothetical protein
MTEAVLNKPAMNIDYGRITTSKKLLLPGVQDLQDAGTPAGMTVAIMATGVVFCRLWLPPVAFLHRVSRARKRHAWLRRPRKTSKRSNLVCRAILKNFYILQPI